MININEEVKCLLCAEPFGGSRYSYNTNDQGLVDKPFCFDCAWRLASLTVFDDESVEDYIKRRFTKHD